MDSRPLHGEPLSLDLVNTEWVADGRRHDLLAEPGGAAAWLAENGLAAEPGASEAVTSTLRETRSALRALLERGERGPLNAVLARGSRTPVLGPDGPGELVETRPGWRAAWEVAAAHLGLLERPDRLRRCAHPACVLYFHDTSRNGTRRWCSMETCGNRAKAGRHYARVREGGSGPPR